MPGRLAQLGEHVPYKHGVTGSSPVPPIAGDVPSELYERLRREAASARRSLGAETIELLRRSLSPSQGVSLEQLLQGADQIRAQHSLPPGSPTAAELIREDRER